MIRVSSESPESIEADWLILIIAASDSVPADLQKLDLQLDGKLSNVWYRHEFAGDYCETLALRQLTEIEPVNLMLVGAGETGPLTAERLRRSLLTALRKINQQKDQHVVLSFDAIVSEHSPPERLIELAVDCATVAPVDAGVHKCRPGRFPFSRVDITVQQVPENADDCVHTGEVIGDSVATVRNMVNRSAMQMTPSQVVADARQMGEQHGLIVEVMDAEQLAAEHMNAMLAVAQGSDEPPALVRVTWQGNPDSAWQLALAGKGVTFDSGGLSIKSSESMIAMKSDMAGAATALAAVHAAARLQLPVNVTAWLGLVENMISGRSFRPGDVITARNGTTIEVQNTDAEGRLVLADVLSWAVDQGATHVIDLATLTGACVVALGEEITGLFPGSENLARRIEQAADSTGEYVWSMPMHDHFDDLLKSDVADCRNIGPRWGGAITAACFLRRFVDETPWVHLDIAGPSWADASAGWRDSGGTGAMVRTLVELLRTWTTAPVLSRRP